MIFLLILLFARVLTSNSLFQVAVSTELYGPDGPWQAVQVGLGTPPQIINLYPGGMFQSSILSREVCEHFTYTICGSGGLFNALESDTYDDRSIAGYRPTWFADPPAISILDTLTLLPAAGSHYGEIKVSRFGIALSRSDYGTYADNSGVFPGQIGYLSLDFHPFLTFGQEQGVSPTVNATLIPGFLRHEGIITSASYGLHFGSGVLNLPLSLWLGGYDATRVIGSVYAGALTNNTFQVDLLDIAFGVDAGASPFPFTSRQGVLPEAYPLTLRIDTGVPWLQFPPSICKSLTRDLPVKFDSKYYLYLWDTSDPRYARIVTSPSYLSFILRAPALSQGKLTIKVPFRLLNLTLSPPVAPAPISYFPCMPSETDYFLGRAFLQAAFLGVDGSKRPTSEWYLAQAPGPDTAPSPYPVTFGENLISGGGNWSETWNNHWTLLADAATKPATTLTSAAAPSLPTTTPSPSTSNPSPYITTSSHSTLTPSPSKSTLAASTTTPPSSTSTSSHSTKTPSPSTSTPSPSKSTPPPSFSSSSSSTGGLSTPTRIGITAAVISLIALAFILAAIAIFRHWRRMVQRGTRRTRTGKGQQRGRAKDQRRRLPPTPPTTMATTTNPRGDPREFQQEGSIRYEAPMPDPVELTTFPIPSHELPPDSQLYEAAPAYPFHSNCWSGPQH